MIARDSNFQIVVKFVIANLMSAEPGHQQPYSLDIGWRVVWQRLGMELNFRDIARWLQIATSTAHRIFNSSKKETSKTIMQTAFRKLDDHHELTNHSNCN